MKIAVRYYTKSGNTAKLANAIADVIGVKAESVSVPLSEKVDILFLGSSYYGFDIDDTIKAFIKENASKIGKIVSFGTAALMGSTQKLIIKCANEYGVTVAAEEFHCRGSFGPMHKGRPNDNDIKNVKAFVKNAIK